jgi:hypothetical protein
MGRGVPTWFHSVLTMGECKNIRINDFLIVYHGKDEHIF